MIGTQVKADHSEPAIILADEKAQWGCDQARIMNHQIEHMEDKIEWRSFYLGFRVPRNISENIDKTV